MSSSPLSSAWQVPALTAPHSLADSVEVVLGWGWGSWLGMPELGDAWPPAAHIPGSPSWPRRPYRSLSAPAAQGQGQGTGCGTCCSPCAGAEGARGRCVPGAVCEGSVHSGTPSQLPQGLDTATSLVTTPWPLEGGAAERGAPHLLSIPLTLPCPAAFPLPSGLWLPTLMPAGFDLESHHRAPRP